MSDLGLCDHCSAPAMAVTVGHAGAHVGDLFRLTRDVPDKHFCMRCWVQQLGGSIDMKTTPPRKPPGPKAKGNDNAGFARAAKRALEGSRQEPGDRTSVNDGLRIKPGINRRGRK